MCNKEIEREKRSIKQSMYDLKDMQKRALMNLAMHDEYVLCENGTYAYSTVRVYE